MPRKLLAWATLSNLLLCCGAVTVVGQPAENKDRWAEAMAEFERSDAENPSEPGGGLFVGSSSIRMWDLPQSFPKLKPLNRGFGGSEISDSVRHFDLLVAKHRPRLVVFYAGDNDVNAGKSAQRVHADYRAFREKLRQSLPETKLLYIAIKPSLARWQLAETIQEANRRIAADCENDKQAEFIDTWTPMLGDDGRPREELFLDDGLHLNEKGYQVWTKELRPHLRPSADDDD